MERIERYKRTVWERHSNQKSGWSRVLVLPVLLYAVSDRNWKLGMAAVAFTLVNPVLFSPPEDTDAWMTRVVLAEEWWVEEQRAARLGTHVSEPSQPSQHPFDGIRVRFRLPEKPVRAALSGMGSMILKFWYVGSLVRRYDAEQSA